MPRVLLTYLSEREFKNLDHGMSRGMWGLPIELSEAPKNFDYVFISSLVKPGGPRTPLASWPAKTMTLTVARRTGPVTAGRSRFWPDEIDSREVRYRTRFPVKHLRTKHSVRLDQGSPLPKAIITEIRRQAIINSPQMISVAEPLIKRLTLVNGV